MYMFVVEEDKAQFVPFYQPDDNNTRKLAAEEGVSCTPYYAEYKKNYV